MNFFAPFVLFRKGSPYHSTGFANLKGVISAQKKENIKKIMIAKNKIYIIENINALLTKLDMYATNLGGSKYVTFSVVLPTHIKSIMLKDIKERITPI